MLFPQVFGLLLALISLGICHSYNTTAAGNSLILQHSLAAGDSLVVCDSTCVQTLFYQVAYSSAANGITEVIAAYRSSAWCSDDQRHWCPQLVTGTLSSIASRVATDKAASVDVENCHERCLLESVADISNRAGYEAMNWAETNVKGETVSGEDPSVKDLHWTMYQLSKEIAKPVKIADDKMRCSLECEGDKRSDIVADSAEPDVDTKHVVDTRKTFESTFKSHGWLANGTASWNSSASTRSSSNVKDVSYTRSRSGSGLQSRSESCDCRANNRLPDIPPALLRNLEESVKGQSPPMADQSGHRHSDPTLIGGNYHETEPNDNSDDSGFDDQTSDQVSDHIEPAHEHSLRPEARPETYGQQGDGHREDWHNGEVHDEDGHHGGGHHEGGGDGEHEDDDDDHHGLLGGLLGAGAGLGASLGAGIGLLGPLADKTIPCLNPATCASKAGPMLSNVVSSAKKLLPSTNWFRRVVDKAREASRSTRELDPIPPREQIPSPPSDVSSNPPTAGTTSTEAFADYEELWNHWDPFRRGVEAELQRHWYREFQDFMEDRWVNDGLRHPRLGYDEESFDGSLNEEAKRWRLPSERLKQKVNYWAEQIAPPEDWEPQREPFSQETYDDDRYSDDSLYDPDEPWDPRHPSHDEWQRLTNEWMLENGYMFEEDLPDREDSDEDGDLAEWDPRHPEHRQWRNEFDEWVRENRHMFEPLRGNHNSPEESHGGLYGDTTGAPLVWDGPQGPSQHYSPYANQGNDRANTHSDESHGNSDEGTAHTSNSDSDYPPGSDDSNNEPGTPEEPDPPIRVKNENIFRFESYDPATQTLSQQTLLRAPSKHAKDPATAHDGITHGLRPYFRLGPNGRIMQDEKGKPVIDYHNANEVQPMSGQWKRIPDPNNGDKYVRYNDAYPSLSSQGEPLVANMDGVMDTAQPADVGEPGRHTRFRLSDANGNDDDPGKVLNYDPAKGHALPEIKLADKLRHDSVHDDDGGTIGSPGGENSVSDSVGPSGSTHSTSDSSITSQLEDALATIKSIESQLSNGEGSESTGQLYSGPKGHMVNGIRYPTEPIWWDAELGEEGGIRTDCGAPPIKITWVDPPTPLPSYDEWAGIPYMCSTFHVNNQRPQHCERFWKQILHNPVLANHAVSLPLYWVLPPELRPQPDPEQAVIFTPKQD